MRFFDSDADTEFMIKTQSSLKNESKEINMYALAVKHRELVCDECQGRGECFLCDSE
jgi:hypothetical protein